MNIKSQLISSVKNDTLNLAIFLSKIFLSFFSFFVVVYLNCHHGEGAGRAPFPNYSKVKSQGFLFLPLKVVFWTRSCHGFSSTISGNDDNGAITCKFLGSLWKSRKWRWLGSDDFLLHCICNGSQPVQFCLAEKWIMWR